MKNPLVLGGYKDRRDWTSDESHGALRARRDLSDRHLPPPPVVVVPSARKAAAPSPGRRARAGDPTADVGASPPSGGPGYFAFLFSVSIRSLAAGPEDAGF